MRTSSQQCIRAMASERRIMLSSCRTVILQADLDTPPEPSRWRRRLYCSTMNSSDSLEIYGSPTVRLKRTCKTAKPEFLVPSCADAKKTHLGFELPGEEQVSADLIQRVESVHRLLHTGMQIHDASGDGVVRHLGYALIFSCSLQLSHHKKRT